MLLCVSSTFSPPPSLHGLLPLNHVSLSGPPTTQNQPLSEALGLSSGHVTRRDHAESTWQSIHTHSRKNVSLLSSEAVNSRPFLAGFPVVGSPSVCLSAESSQREAKKEMKNRCGGWGRKRERGEEGRSGGTRSRSSLLPIMGSWFPQFVSSAGFFFCRVN